MKKLLLGSTALVVGGVMAAPAMAADPIKIGIGGYYTFYALAGNVDSTYAFNGSLTTYRGFAFTQEGEIHFTGQTKLDNGTSVGLLVELEAWNPSTGANTGVNPGSNSTIDEAFIFAFGDWGRAELGSRDAASYRMYYGTPSALIGWGAIQHNHNWANAAMMFNNKAYGRTMATTITPTWQDVNRINYFTPRFQGLQIGVGYAPKLSLTVAGAQAGTGIGGTQSAGLCGYQGPANIGNCPTADSTWQNLFDIGANYLNKFGDFTVALYGAFAYASFIPAFAPGVGSNIATGANLAPWKQWVAGAQFGYAGFTVGGAVGWDNNGLGSNYYTGMDNDTRFYTAGIMYETGPWQMSFMWAGFYNTNGNGSASITALNTNSGFFAQTLNTAGCGGVPGVNSTCFSGNPATSLLFGSETVNKWEVGVNYALGPGVKITGGGVMFNASGPTNAVSGNSWALLLGMDLRF